MGAPPMGPGGGGISIKWALGFRIKSSSSGFLQTKGSRSSILE